MPEKLALGLDQFDGSGSTQLAIDNEICGTLKAFGLKIGLVLTSIIFLWRSAW